LAKSLDIIILLEEAKTIEEELLFKVERGGKQNAVGVIDEEDIISGGGDCSGDWRRNKEEQLSG
jgi:hypothetical protein